jgi:hypothetical protein
MVQPTVANKRNLGLLAINQTFKQVREHPGTIFGSAAVICIPIAFVAVIAALRPGLGSSLLQMVVGGIIGVWVAYATTVAVGMFAEGNDPGAGGLVGRSLSAGLVRFTFTSLLYGLVLGAAVLVTLIPFFMSLASVDPEALLALRLADDDLFRIAMGLVLSMPFVLAALMFVTLKFGLAQTASALEGSGPAPSLSRSWRITRGHVWEFFVLTFLSGIIAFGISIVVSGPAAMVSLRPDAPTGSESLTPEFFRSQMFGESLGPGEAVVTGISAYLATVVLGPLAAGFLANFFLLLKNPPVPIDPRSLLIPHQGTGDRTVALWPDPPAVAPPADPSVVPPSEAPTEVVLPPPPAEDQAPPPPADDEATPPPPELPPPA